VLGLEHGAPVLQAAQALEGHLAAQDGDHDVAGRGEVS